MSDTPSSVKRAYNLGLKIVPNIHSSLSEEEIAYYENHLAEIPEALRRGFVIPDKFALLADLGTIVVPEDYDHATCLAKFHEENKAKFAYYSEALTDANFPKPSRILKPGDRLRVRAWKQVVPGTTTSEERLAFLAKQKSVHTGAQGATLVFRERRDQLPKGFWYASFDEKKALWKDAVGYPRVPEVDANSHGGFNFFLGNFELVWDDSNAFLSFCDEPALEAGD